jgi:hypothetical protein
MKKLNALVLAISLLFAPGCGVALVAAAAGYTASAIGNKNTEQHRAYSDYTIKAEALNIDRHKAGLAPVPVITFEEWNR